MKKIILVVLLSMGYLITAQQEGNPFYEEENSAKKADLSEKPGDGEVVVQGPGNPDGDDDLPIDDYIPLLIITALGVIVYQTYPKKRTTVEKN